MPDINKFIAATKAFPNVVTVKLVAERRGAGWPGSVLPNGKPDPNDPPDDGLIKAEHVRVECGAVVFEVDVAGRTDQEIEDAILKSLNATPPVPDLPAVEVLAPAPKKTP